MKRRVSVMFFGFVLESQGPLNLEIPSVAVSFFFSPLSASDCKWR